MRNAVCKEVRSVKADGGGTRADVRDMELGARQNLEAGTVRLGHASQRHLKHVQRTLAASHGKERLEEQIQMYIVSCHSVKATFRSVEELTIDSVHSQGTCCQVNA